MAATGNITADLEAIRALVRPGTFGFEVYEIEGWFPWSPPATDKEIEAACARMPGLPDEVIEIFRVSANVVAGGLNFKWGLEDMAPYHKQEYYEGTGRAIGFIPSDDLHTDISVENDNGWVPDDGDIVFLGNSSAMPTTGPHLGVVYTTGFLGWQRAAYRLSDVVACNRELYENGWYEHLDFNGRFNKSDEFGSVFEELVQPVIDRWHCSPRIASLGRHVEPSRPPDL